MHSLTAADCAVCGNDSAAGYAYSCHKCSGDYAVAATGFGVAVLVAVLLVVAVFVSDLVRVVGDEAREEDDGRGTRRCWESMFVSCHTVIVKAFPLTAVKTVVVVWQITTQVRCRVHMIKHPRVEGVVLGWLGLVSCS